MSGEYRRTGVRLYGNTKLDASYGILNNHDNHPSVSILKFELDVRTQALGRKRTVEECSVVVSTLVYR